MEISLDTTKQSINLCITCKHQIIETYGDGYNEPYSVDVYCNHLMVNDIDCVMELVCNCTEYQKKENKSYD